MKHYLDHNATTPLHPQVMEAITEALPLFGNPSSLHGTGRSVKNKLHSAITSIAQFLGVAEDDLIITSCASESNNTVLKTLLPGTKNKRPHLITSGIEHPSIMETGKYLAGNGVDVTYLPIDKDGVISVKDVKAAIRPETELISIMYANNEIGTVQPVLEIGALAKSKGILFHTDAVQAAGKIKLNLKEMPIDAASFSAHKMYAPKGIGILYIKDFKKNKYKISTLIHGGHQAQGFRAGTENTLGIIAFGAACKAMQIELDTEIDHLNKLTETFEKMVKDKIPDIQINGEKAPRKPGTSNISFKYIEGESILLRLDMHGIAVSTGSACSTDSLDPSHVIMALAHDPEVAHGSIRFSFGRDNKVEDLEEIVHILAHEVCLLRQISPLIK